MRKLLIVEDEPSLREVYQVILSTEPYLIDVASHGREALDKCRTMTYDLILLDMKMPIVDGLSFLKEFFSGDYLASKVIVMSNLSAGVELSEAVRLGAAKTILKSDLSPRQLLATVRYELEA